MSETMKNPVLKGNKSKRFVDGRLRLSTSCTECHRRKQKCDQKQPCRNCVRRYPPPECVYRNKPETDAQKASSAKSGVSIGKSESEVVTSFNKVSEQLDGPDYEAQVIKKENSPEKVDLLEEIFDLQWLITHMVSHSLSTNESENLSIAHGKANRIQPNSAEGRVSRQTVARYAHQAEYGTPGRLGANMMDPLHFLPIQLNLQNAELLQGFVRILAKHVSSIDGKPLPNYYNDHWLPWAIHIPVLVHIALYNTACYQAELQRVPPGVSPSVIALKLKTISILNRLLASANECTRDEVAASVVYLTTNEWYFGTEENVQAHLRGLRELVRLKGGIDGKMSVFLRRMIIFCDYHISSSNNARPIFSHYTPHPISIQTTLDSPLLISQQQFLDHVNLLRISKEAGQILDDMRFLTSSILKPADTISTPSEQSVKKLLVTTKWMLDRIAKLPPLMPSSDPPTNPYLYTAVRLAALIYLRAIAKRVPLSQACLPQDLAMLFGSMWKVTLTEWRHIPGIFIWIMLSAIEAARYAPQGRLLKSMLKTASFHILACGDNGWDIIDAKLGRFARLQAWLRRDDSAKMVYQIENDRIQNLLLEPSLEPQINARPVTEAEISAYAYQTRSSS